MNMITEQLTLTYISTTSSIEQCLSIDDEELVTLELNNDVRAGMGDDYRMTP